MEPGSYFGEIAVIDGGPRTGTISAETAVASLELTPSALLRLLDQEPGVARAMYVELQRHLFEPQPLPPPDVPVTREMPGEQRRGPESLEVLGLDPSKPQPTRHDEDEEDRSGNQPGRLDPGADERNGHPHPRLRRGDHSSANRRAQNPRPAQLGSDREAPVWMARTVSIVSASSGRLSGR